MALGAEVSKRVGRGDGSVGVSASSDVGLGVVTMTSRAASARAVCVAATSTVTTANAVSAASPRCSDASKSRVMELINDPMGCPFGPNAIYYEDGTIEAIKYIPAFDFREPWKSEILCSYGDSYWRSTSSTNTRGNGVWGPRRDASLGGRPTLEASSKQSKYKTTLGPQHKGPPERLPPLHDELRHRRARDAHK